ncbi:hypothetical protein P3X46_012620 [Hevea brasiliensis]|nr:phytosulfokines 3 [Hevea brasiliensis]KAF2283791.1 hypothetical protein GH714_015913 [Hevea brasiliensis]KAJ9177398.1 hypothetical protein P3X46_012620 [Hevea brasiliensis]
MVKLKVATLFILVTLILSSTAPLTYSARHEPGFSIGSLAKDQQQDVDEAEVVEESCEGAGEEQCLMRRTLAAHIDYIYTQKHKP